MEAPATFDDLQAGLQALEPCKHPKAAKKRVSAWLSRHGGQALEEPANVQALVQVFPLQAWTRDMLIGVFRFNITAILRNFTGTASFQEAMKTAAFQRNLTEAALFCAAHGGENIWHELKAFIEPQTLLTVLEPYNVSKSMSGKPPHINGKVRDYMQRLLAESCSPETIIDVLKHARLWLDAYEGGVVYSTALLALRCFRTDVFDAFLAGIPKDQAMRGLAAACKRRELSALLLGPRLKRTRTMNRQQHKFTKVFHEVLTRCVDYGLPLQQLYQDTVLGYTREGKPLHPDKCLLAQAPKLLQLIEALAPDTVPTPKSLFTAMRTLKPFYKSSAFAISGRVRTRSPLALAHVLDKPGAADALREVYADDITSLVHSGPSRMQLGHAKNEVFRALSIAMRRIPGADSGYHALEKLWKDFRNV